MSKKKKKTGGNPAKRADKTVTPVATPTSDAMTVEKVIQFMEFQRDEARRRKEPEVWENYLFETQVNIGMSERIITPGLGTVPSDMMKLALTRLGAD